MKKQELREKIRNLKSEHFAYNNQAYYNLSSQMVSNVLLFPLYNSSTTEKIALFASKKASFEISTDILVGKSIEMGKHVYLPRCVTSSRDLEYIRIKNLNQDTEIGAFSIREPCKNMEIEDQDSLLRNFDIALVPGVAFDLHGNRLGFGSGYYDKFIRKLRQLDSDLKVVALAFDFQVYNEEIPNNAKDEKVDYIITPSAFFKATQ